MKSNNWITKERKKEKTKQKEERKEREKAQRIQNITINQKPNFGLTGITNLKKLLIIAGVREYTNSTNLFFF